MERDRLALTLMAISAPTFEGPGPLALLCKTIYVVTGGLHFTTRNQRSVLVGDSNTRVLSSRNCSSACRLEKAKTCPQEDRDDADVDFVHQPGSQTLLSGIRATYHHDMFVACGCFCPLNSVAMPSVIKVIVNWSFCPLATCSGT